MIKKILFISMVLVFSQLSCLDTLNDAYDAESDIPRSGLVGEWLFDSNIGTTTYDTSGSGNDGTVNGATLTSSGYNGQAYSFASLNYISIPDSNILDVDYITVSFYIYPISWGKIIMKDDENGGGNPGTYQVEINNTNKLDFSCFTGSSRSIVDVVGDVIAMNQWYHVACTFNGSMLRIYLNGSLYSEASSGSITSLQKTTMNTYISYCPGGSTNFTGTIDSVRIYNRALSANEIKLLASE